jgi:hypothetical protein
MAIDKNAYFWQVMQGRLPPPGYQDDQRLASATATAMIRKTGARRPLIQESVA